MLTTIQTMYITLMPIILAAVVNSVFCSSRCLSMLKKPIDAGMILRDGERLFGDHKTWKGFFGYILFGIVCALLWGAICGAAPYLETHNYFYMEHENTPGFNLWIGFLQGLFYALFEFPNSFIKRRLKITPGKNPDGRLKGLFVFLDQADSIFGLVLVVCMFHPLPVWFYFVYVLAGALTHIVVNMLLYACKIRKNMF